MDDARPHPRQDFDAFDASPHTRAELVRFFAWGYLSRRELNARLKLAEADVKRRPGRRRAASQAA